MGHEKPSRRDSSDASIGDSNLDPRFSEVSAAVVEHLPHLRAFARSQALNVAEDASRPKSLRRSDGPINRFQPCFRHLFQINPVVSGKSFMMLKH